MDTPRYSAPRPGRPRIVPTNSNRPAREEILDGAAHLFVAQGYIGTSTREIAERVGIRQASIYYHFPLGKEEILAELLQMSVRPTLDSLGDLDQVETDEAALYLLALHDTRALATVMHNIGVLPLLPEVARTPACDDYKAAHRDLRQTYAVLGMSCASPAVARSIDKPQLGWLIVENVESVIGTRASGASASDDEIQNIAATCLRVCGVTDTRIKDAAHSANAALRHSES